MIGLIVTGHGNFASGLTSSLKLIAGEPKNYVAVDFLESYSVDDLEREITKELDELKDSEGDLVLYDLVVMNLSLFSRKSQQTESKRKLMHD